MYEQQTEIKFVTIDGQLEIMTEENTFIVWLDEDDNILKWKTTKAYLRYRRAQAIKKLRASMPRLHIKNREIVELAKLMRAS